MKKVTCLFVCMLLILMMSAACGSGDDVRGTVPTESGIVTDAPTTGTEPLPSAEAAEPAEPTQPIEDTRAATEPEEDGSGILEFPAVSSDCFDIETPFGMLQYPLMWGEYVLVEQMEQDDALVISFYGILEGRDNHHLFDVIFGDGEGDYVGQILTGDEAVPVFFRTFSVYEDETLSVDEVELLIAMVEDINVIYTSLYSIDDFQ